MTKRKSPRFRAVYIEWVDSGSRTGWERTGDDYGFCTIRTLGILVGEDKKRISITTSHSRNDLFVDIITIPKVAITHIRRFKF